MEQVPFLNWEIQMRTIKIILRNIKQHLVGFELSLVFVIGGSVGIYFGFFGAASVDRNLNLIVGIIAVLAGGGIFWRLIGVDIIKELKRHRTT